MKLIEPILAVISIISFAFVQNDNESARLPLIFGSIGLALMYLFYSYIYRIKAVEKNDTELAFNAFTQKLIFYLGIICSVTITTIEGFQKIQYNTMLLSVCITLTILSFIFLAYYNLKYKVKLNLLFYTRILIFGLIVLYLYIKYDNKPPFFG